MSPVPALLGLVALGLFGIIGAELLLGGDIATPPPPAPPAARVDPPHVPPPDHSAAQIATMLERPLFAPDRRPVAAAPGSVQADAPLPRLAGVIVDRAGASGLFVAGGRTVVVRAGGTVGGYAVKAIEAGKVTVQGPDGPRVLRPTFANATGAGAAASDAPGGAAPSGPALLRSLVERRR